MKVWTHAGLSSRESRLFTPANALLNAPMRLGEGDRESGDEGGESGGAGNRV